MYFKDAIFKIVRKQEDIVGEVGWVVPP